MCLFNVILQISKMLIGEGGVGVFERRKAVNTCEIAMVYLGKEGFYAIDKKLKIIKSEHMKPLLRV